VTAPTNRRGLRAGLRNAGLRLNSEQASGGAAASRILSASLRSPLVTSAKKQLRVMKFGGTSVGDASCIERVVRIVRAASRESNVVVVVSAMSGVTNQLIESARQSELGNQASAMEILEALRQRHLEVASALVRSVTQGERVFREMSEIFREGAELCRATILPCRSTSQTRDSVASLGERLSACLVTAALAESGSPSESIDATELVITNAHYGAADPCMDVTYERCEARIQPLLKQGIVPVVTGFLGGTPDGERTTLGRGGSDYSATILGSALGADEIIIWTDVDGVLTADPRLVPDARVIPEISYHIAADLAYFGAKVLHPKTLRPLMNSCIPVWIRNTFAPERRGTKITATDVSSDRGVRALTSIKDVSMITIAGPGTAAVANVLGRTFTTAAAIRADVLLISHSSSRNHICFLVPSEAATSTVQALREEFAQDLADEKVEHISCDPAVAIVTIVGQKMQSIAEIVARTFCALSRENMNVMAIAQGSSEYNLSFVVPREHMKAALITTHREFQLGDRSEQHVLR
jgi:bifunctional aspartokinase / homoserine dehydrogenase 1